MRVPCCREVKIRYSRLDVPTVSQFRFAVPCRRHDDAIGQLGAGAREAIGAPLITFTPPPRGSWVRERLGEGLRLLNLRIRVNGGAAGDDLLFDGLAQKRGRWKVGTIEQFCATDQRRRR